MPRASIQIQGFVYAEERQTWERKAGAPDHKVYVLPYRSAAPDTWGICVGPIDVSFELPEGFDVKAETIRQKVEALLAAKAEAGRKFAAEVAQINSQLATLQAIEHTPADVGAGE
jgi:hypothetical protein